MRISPVMQNSYTGVHRAPAFQSIIRNVKDSEGNIKNSNTTCFFRQDLHWNEMATFMDRKYDKSEKVNVYSYGCSDGSEPMSLAVLLNQRFGYNARKFFPIMAKDNDDYILDKIRSSCTRMYFSDIDAVIHYSNNNLGKYFVINNQLPVNNSMIVHPSYETKSKIRYSKADVVKDVNKLPEKDTVVMFRNILPYIDEKYQDKVVDTITSKLKDNCMIVIGDLEDEMGIGRKLEEAGFRKTPMPHVYEN